MNLDVKKSQVLQNEAGLVQRARCGDSEAVAAIYAQYQQAVFTYVYYRVSDQECAEDLTAEVFVRMMTKLPDYIEHGQPILAWLYTIAHNLVIDHYRHSNERQDMPLEDSLIAGEGGHPPKERTRSFCSRPTAMTLSGAPTLSWCWWTARWRKWAHPTCWSARQGPSGRSTLARGRSYNLPPTETEPGHCETLDLPVAGSFALMDQI